MNVRRRCPSAAAVVAVPVDIQPVVVVAAERTVGLAAEDIVVAEVYIAAVLRTAEVVVDIAADKQVVVADTVGLRIVARHKVVAVVLALPVVPVAAQ